MATSALNAVQKGIYDSLGAISSFGASIYDFVPQNASYPYVRIGLDSAVEFDTKPTTGNELDATIHIWAQAAGAKSIKTIMDKIYQRLHRQEANLTATGYTVVQCLCNFQTVMLESSHDGGDKYYHGVMRFTIRVQE